MNKNPKLSDAHVAEAVAHIADGMSVTAAAKQLGVARTSLITAIARYEREQNEAHEPGVQTHDDGGLTVSGIPSVGGITLSPDNLLRKYGIDPDEVMIVRDRLNVWGNDDSPNFQLRLDVIPKNLLVLPDADREWLPAPQPVKRAAGEPLRWAYMGDHHAPFIDFGLHQTSLAYLRDFQPHLVVLGGDLLNNQKWARHRPRPRFVEAANQGIRVGGSIIRDVRAACPDAEIVWLPGNHDQWIEQRMIEDRNQVLGVRGYEDDYDVMDLRRLLGTDSVHVKYIDEDWDLAYWPITKNFAASHGGKSTGKNAADVLFASLTGSSIHGHSHRGKMTFHTRHNPVTGETECHLSIEAMMMARHDGGIGYANTPDWMQGFFYGSAWEDDDMFAAAPAPYIDDQKNGGYLLLPDGTRYKSTVDKFGNDLATGKPQPLTHGNLS